MTCLPKNAEGLRLSTSFGDTSQESGQSNAVIQLQPLALPLLAAAQFLSISKHSLSRLIADGKIIARKEGSKVRACWSM
jgi:hypothetical protein